MFPYDSFCVSRILFIRKPKHVEKDTFLTKTIMLFNDTIDPKLALCTLLTYPFLINRFSTWTISATCLIDRFISDLKTNIEYVIEPCHADIISFRT